MENAKSSSLKPSTLKTKLKNNFKFRNEILNEFGGPCIALGMCVISNHVNKRASGP